MRQREESLLDALACVARHAQGGWRGTPSELRSEAASWILEEHREWLEGATDGQLVRLLTEVIPHPENCALWYREEDGKFRLVSLQVGSLDLGILRKDLDGLGWIDRYHELAEKEGDRKAVSALVREWFAPYYASLSPLQCRYCHIDENLADSEAAGAMKMIQGHRVHEQCVPGFHAERKAFERALQTVLSGEENAQAA